MKVGVAFVARTDDQSLAKLEPEEEATTCLGGSHSLVESSAPTILRAPGSNPYNNIYAFFQLIQLKIIYLSFELECEKDKNKQKRGRGCPNVV